MKKLKLFPGSCFIHYSRACLIQAENIIKLVAGNDSGKMQFALSELQMVLNEKGHESVFFRFHKSTS
jgi:hypothetical protein